MTKDEALKLALEALRQIDEAIPFPVAKLAQAAIKEALAQPEQEPVAWRYRMPVEDGHFVWNYATYIDDPKDQRCEPLYTTPPQRPSRSDIKPLTDEEIWEACAPLGAAMLSFTEVARAIEAAHGIKGEA